MQSSALPSKIQLPFANAGSKNTIPVSSQIGITAGAASFTDGFPPLTRTPLAAGGVPPSGSDMNGILNAITAVQQWQSAGGVFKYDPSFSSAIGGYPKGSVLMSSTNAKQWLSLSEANTTDPDSASSANWLSMSGSYQGFAAYLSTANLAMTDIGKIITLSGTSGGILTLPMLSSLPEGAACLIKNESGAAWSVACAPSDGSGMAYSNGAFANIQIYRDDFIVFVKGTGGTAVWRTYGTGTLPYSGSFIASQAPSGYQRLPTGTIIQWGIGVSYQTSTGNTVNFPIQFPNACLQVVAVDSGNSYYLYGANSLQKYGFTLYCQSAPGTFQAGTARFIAIGY